MITLFWMSHAPHFKCSNLFPKVIVGGSRTFGKWWIMKMEASRMKKCQDKGVPESSFVLLPVIPDTARSQKHLSKSESWPSLELTSAQISDLPVSRTVELSFCFMYILSDLLCFVLTAHDSDRNIHIRLASMHRVCTHLCIQKCLNRIDGGTGNLESLPWQRYTWNYLCSREIRKMPTHKGKWVGFAVGLTFRTSRQLGQAGILICKPSPIK